MTPEMVEFEYQKIIQWLHLLTTHPHTYVDT